MIKNLVVKLGETAVMGDYGQDTYLTSDKITIFKESVNTRRKY